MFDLSETTTASVDLLEKLGVMVAFAPNREIYAESEPATDLYSIISGAVRSYKILHDGRRQIGDFYIAGDVLGFELREKHALSAELPTSGRVGSNAAPSPRSRRPMLHLLSVSGHCRRAS